MWVSFRNPENSTGSQELVLVKGPPHYLVVADMDPLSIFSILVDKCVGAAFSQLLTSSKLRGGAISRKILGSEPGISVLTVPSNDFSFL